MKSLPCILSDTLEKPSLSTLDIWSILHWSGFDFRLLPRLSLLFSIISFALFSFQGTISSSFFSLILPNKVFSRHFPVLWLPFIFLQHDASASIPVLFNKNTADWWRWGGSNSWPPACKAGALPAELHPQILSHTPVCPLVGLSGLEPPTSRLSGVRSNRLSYRPISCLLTYLIPCLFSKLIKYPWQQGFGPFQPFPFSFILLYKVQCMNTEK